ncbi:MAG: hypothetical protein ACPMAQ_09445 [Phycisphaerae bacterium]
MPDCNPVSHKELRTLFGSSVAPGRGFSPVGPGRYEASWTLDYGKGRVFNIVLGHDAKVCRDPNFVRLLQRGAEWVAKKDTK